jgi:hypothetical protein
MRVLPGAPIKSNDGPVGERDFAFPMGADRDIVAQFGAHVV